MRKPKKDEKVLYLGNLVSKEHFRVYVYGKESKKLVNSYEEYENALSSGEWFSTIEDAGLAKTKKVKANDDSKRVCT